MNIRLKILVVIILILAAGFTGAWLLAKHGKLGNVSINLNPPQAAKSWQLRLSGTRDAALNDFGTEIKFPDRWEGLISSDKTDILVRIKNDPKSTCQVHLKDGENIGNGSATSYLTINDLGPRFGAAVKDTKQGLVTISGWHAASFEWVDKNNIRYREVYIPYSGRLLSITYQENLNALREGLQPFPCYQDFDKLLESITLPH